MHAGRLLRQSRQLPAPPPHTPHPQTTCHLIQPTTCFTPPPHPTPQTPPLCRALAEAVKAAANSFKPKPTLKVPDIDDLPEVPKNLHKVRPGCVEVPVMCLSYVVLMQRRELVAYVPASLQRLLPYNVYIEYVQCTLRE
jgi:hypothetical protein